MNDLKLAKAIVAHGIGIDWKDGTFGFGPNLSPLDSLESFLVDWQVVGALLELCVGKPDWMQVILDRKCSSEVTHRCWVERTHSGIEVETYHARDDSLPRSMIEACIKALKV